MPSKPRCEVFVPDEVGVYHCWNRLVQRRRLFGFDPLTSKDYTYRKNWVHERFKQLAGAMAIDVLDFAILDNHLHVVLRNRPDIVSTWSDEEVACRWWTVCPLRKNDDGSIPDPKPCEIALLVQNADAYRRRLSDISWMMRLACQPIARRANQEDGVDGRFFAKRFDCERLKTSADVLACSVYVDLNLIRAGMATTPEESEFTSAFDRVRARWQQIQKELGTSFSLPSEEEADAWLAPIFLDERAGAYTQTRACDSECEAGARSSPICNAIGAPRISNKGFLPMTRDQYLALLDTLGRIVRTGKRGFIPRDLPPILARLKLDVGRWLDSILDAFGSDPMAAAGAPVTAFG